MDINKRKKLIKMFFSLKVLNKKLISTYEDGYIGKKVYQVTLQDGSSRLVEQITKNKGNGDAVVIIPITADGNFVMVVQSRPNTEETVVVEFPAGMVDSGEEPIESAKRELFEETGYVADTISELEWHYQDQGCSKAIIRTYIAKGCRKVQKQQLDGNEKLGFIEMEYDEIIRMLEQEDNTKPKISDANSKIAVLEYTLKKRKFHE